MRNILRDGIFLVLVLSLLTLNVLALPNSSNDSVKLENKSDEPLGISMSIDFIPYTQEELRDYSDTIVIGTVKEILSPKWNTIDGKQPNKAVTEINPREDLIYTDVVIGVEEYLKNPLSSNKVIVRSIGGTTGNISMTSDAEPSFKTGEKVLLYLSKDDNPSTKDIGPEHFIVTNYYQGKFTLSDDGKAIVHVETSTLDELLSTINQTANKTNDTGMSNNKGTISQHEGNSSSTLDLKTAPFISSVWVIAAVFGAVMYLRRKK